MPGAREYPGEGITVRFDLRRCIHARECVQGLPAVFDAQRRPWIDAGAAPADEIASVVRRCPTGALTYERADGGASEAPPQAPEIRLVRDGPLHVRGRIELCDPDGTVRCTETRVALCRCGASGNKPFCDGSHTEAGFRG